MRSILLYLIGIPIPIIILVGLVQPLLDRLARARAVKFRITQNNRRTR